MGTGYVRADTANNISNGNVIDADDLDNEFNAVEAAFNVSTGHTHDGTASEGAPIEVLGPSQDIVATVSTLRPKTTNTVDLGTTTLRYKDLYLEGNADIDGTVNVEGATTLQSTLAAGNTTITGDLTVSGNATISGNLTFGDAITDTITLTADVSSNILPSADDTYDLGATGSEWRDLYIDGIANIDTAYIGTGNIGTLAVSGNGTVTGDLTVTGDINATVVGTASTADALTTARTITLDGDVSGAVNFDGSTNVTLTTTIADDSHNHTIANVDGLQTALDAKQATITGAATTIDDTDLTADRAVISDASGKVAVSSVTSTELGRLSGVTSAIQTQLDAKLDSVDLSSYTGDVDITGELVVDSYNETYAAITSSSGTATIDCEAGNVFALTLSENVTTFTWSNPPASGTAYGFSLKVIQGSSAYTITWPPAVDWPNATAPTLSTGSGAVDQFVFYTHDGGTTWYGFVAGQALG
jgi:cytoskeletal protein CcmA (bactofilin family)